MNWVHSRRFQLSLLVILMFFCIFAVWRMVFFLHFFGFDSGDSREEILQALYIGLKFDMRLAIFLAVPLMFACVLPKVNFFDSAATRMVVDLLMTLSIVAVTFVYIVDFGNYAYLAERVDASILRFFDTPDISLLMVWESYPVLWLSLLIIVTGSLISWGFKKLFNLFVNRPRPHITRTQGLVGMIICSFFLLHGVVGKWNAITLQSVSLLRWSDAYFSRNQDIAALGLNPVLFFIDTFEHQTKPYDLEVLDETQGLVAAYLGADVSPESYRRDVDVYETDLIHRKERAPNIVLFMLESLGANRLGVFGNPANATPNLDALAANGHFFNRFYVPSSGTARTVFGKITGIPDVSYGGTTASRNPRIVDQQVIVNTLDQYNKYYFIGGGAQWANIQALLVNNIEGLKLYEEGDWKGRRIDVWGISDRDLIKESHEILENRADPEKPFFAVIQTAANHRPFTIPDDGSGFEKSRIPDEEVQKHGFLGTDQYNAIRLLDYNVGYYFNELVANSSYGENTIFLLYGDQ